MTGYLRKFRNHRSSPKSGSILSVEIGNRSERMVGCSDLGRFQGIKLLEIAESFTPFSASQVIGLEHSLGREEERERKRLSGCIYKSIYAHTFSWIPSLSCHWSPGMLIHQNGLYIYMYMYICTIIYIYIYIWMCSTTAKPLPHQVV